MYYQIVDDTMYIGSTKWADDCVAMTSLGSYNDYYVKDNTVKYVRMKNPLSAPSGLLYNSTYHVGIFGTSITGCYLDQPIRNVDFTLLTPSLTILEFGNSPLTSGLWIESALLTTIEFPTFMGGALYLICDKLETVSDPTGYGALSITSSKLKNINLKNLVYEYGYQMKYYSSTNPSSYSLSSTGRGFLNCTALESIDVNVYVMAGESLGYNGMFAGCTSLKTAKVYIRGIYDTQYSGNAYNFPRAMFYNCTSLETVTGNIITSNCSYMFYNCSSLKTINCSGDWYGSATGNSVFYGCTSLVGGNGTTYDSSKTGISMAVIDQDGQEGYLTYTKNRDLYNVNIINDIERYLYNTGNSFIAGNLSGGSITYEVTDSQHMVAAGSTYNIKQTNTSGTAMVGAVVVDANGVANVYQGNDITFPVESELNVYIIRDLPNITLNAVIKAIANPQ